MHPPVQVRLVDVEIHHAGIRTPDLCDIGIPEPPPGLKALDYDHTDIASWLGEGYACGAVGEMVADLERFGKRHAVITGVVEGGDPGVQAEIEEWCRAARILSRTPALPCAKPS